LLLATSTGLILVVQPDAGQATAFGLGAVIIFLLTGTLSYLHRFLVRIVLGMSIVIAWYQPDTLPPVKQVELILQLAITMGILGVFGIVLTIFLLIFPIFLAFKQQAKKINDDDWVLAVAYMVYFLTQLLVTGLGNFPVPIIGAGAAPVLGWYLILGFLIIKKSYYGVNNYSS
jgi:cell division protein FtsW (lipid II flippase)